MEITNNQKASSPSPLQNNNLSVQDKVVQRIYTDKIEPGEQPIGRDIFSLQPVKVVFPESSLSIYTDCEGFPSLSAEERTLFESILRKWPLEQLILMDYLGMACSYAWDNLLTLEAWNSLLKWGNTTTKNTFEELRDSFKASYFKCYTFLMKMEPSNYVTDSSNFFKSPREFAELLETQTLLTLSEGLPEINYQNTTSKLAELRKKIAVKVKKEIQEKITSLRQLIRLFQKFLNTSNSKEILIKTSLLNYKEMSILSLDGELIPLQSYCHFFDDLLSTAQRCSLFLIKSSVFKKCEENLLKITQHKKVDPQVFDKLLLKELLTIAHLEQEEDDYFERALSDLEFTHASYCQERNMQPQATLDRKEFLNYLSAHALSLCVAGNALMDIFFDVQEALAKQTDEYKSSLLFLNRLINNLLLMQDILTKPESTAQNPPPNVLDPLENLYLPINQEIRALCAEILSLFPKEGLSKIWTVCSLLQKNYRAGPASIHAFLPLRRAVSATDTVIKRIQEIHKNLLKVIEHGKERNLIAKSDRERVEEFLVEDLRILSSLVLILQDTKILFTDAPLEEQKHILPPALVDLLELKGFDEIFKETPAPINGGKMEEKLAPSKKVKAKRATPQEKTIPVPDKAEVMKATTPRKIFDILDRYGFKLEKSGNGSHKKRYNEKGELIVVPQVLKPGLLHDIYKTIRTAWESAQKK